MDDVFVIEASNDMDDCVRFANVAEELIAEALPLGRPLHESGDIDELDGGRHDGL